MAPKGLYRTKTPDGDAESAFVDYGLGTKPKELGRVQYETNLYWPPFRALLTKEEYEARNPIAANGQPFPSPR